MKLNRFLIATSMIICVSLQYVVAEDSSQWSLPENAIARIGKGRITDIKYSPDGKLLAVGSSTGTWLYDAHTYVEIALLSGHTYSDFAKFRGGSIYRHYDTNVIFSPDGKTLVTSCWNENIRLWDVQTHKHITTLTPESWEKTFRLWEAEKGKDKIKYPERMSSAEISVVSPDGKTFASDGFGNTIRLWDAKTGKRKKTLIGHKKTVKVLAFSPNGETLASGSWDKTVRLWNIKTEKHKATLIGHNDGVKALAFSPDGKTLASASYDGTIRFWNTQTSRHKNTITHNRFKSPMVLSPNGKTLVTSEDGDLFLWDIGTSKLKTLFSSDTEGAHSILWSTYMGVVYAILHSQDGTTLANYVYKGKSRRFLLWNVHTGKRREPFTQNLQDVFSKTVVATLSPDGSILATGKTDGPVHLWDTHSGQHKFALKKHEGWVSAVAFSSDGSLLATEGPERTIHLWETRNGDNIATFTVPTGYGSITALAFSPDGSLLAGTSSVDLSLWNLKTGESILTLGHEEARSLAFSPDGKILASGSRDSSIRLWDTQTGILQETLIGHIDDITALAFLPPTNLSETVNAKSNAVSQTEYTLASLSEDRTVLLWKVKPIVDTNAVVKLTPHLVESPTVGEQMTLNINIGGAKNITGYQITMEFDNTSLQYVSSKNGDYLSADISAEVTHINPNRVKLLSTTSTKNGNGDGRLASVMFEVLDLKASTLSLPKVRLEKRDGSLARPTVIGSTVSNPKQKQIVPVHYTEMALPEGATTRLGKGKVKDMKFSPDNTLLAVATSIGIWIYDAFTGDELALIRGHAKNETVIAFSPDGHLLASSQYHGNIHLWNTHTHQLVKTLTDERTDGNYDLVFFPDGRTLFNGKKLWNIHTGQLIATIISGNADYITAAAVSPDGTTLATLTKERRIQLWDPHTKQQKFVHDYTKNKNQGSIHHLIRYPQKLVFSPDGTMLGAVLPEHNGPNNNRILLLNIHNGQLLDKFKGENRTPFFLSMYFTVEGHPITIVREANKAVQLWNTKTNANIATLTRHADDVHFVEVSPNRSICASAERNGVINLWDIETEKLIATIAGHEQVPTSVALSADGTTLAMPNGNRGLDFWDRYKKRIATFPLRTDDDDFWSPTTYAFSPEWKIIAASKWRKIRLWDTMTEKNVATLTTDDNSFEVENIVYSPDGRTLAAKQRYGNKILLWNTHTREQIATLKGHSGNIHAITFSPDGALLASCSGQRDNGDNTIRLWDTKTGKQRTRINNILKTKQNHASDSTSAIENILQVNQKHSFPIISAVFSPDGKTIASIDANTDIELWDVKTGKHKTTVYAKSKTYYHHAPKYTIAFSPDGTTLATAVHGIDLWDVETGKLQKTLKGHSGIITSLQYSEDGTTLVSSSADGTALFWEMRQTPVTRLQITPRSVRCPPAGQQISFDIYMTAAQDVSGYQFLLEYDTKLLRFIPNTDNSIRNTEKDKIAFIGNASSGATIKDGLIASVTFEVIKRADVTLTITDAQLTYKNGERSRPVVGHAWVFQPQRMPEDVNLDWQIDDADLEFVSARLGQKGKDNPADVNKDGIVDIADLVLIRNALYGLANETPIH